MAKNDVQCGGWNSLLYLAMYQNHDIDFARWLHPAMWHVSLGSWQWIHQVAAPCNVIRSSGIMTLNSPGGSTRQCGRLLSRGWHAMEFAQTSAILKFYIWFRFRRHHRSRHVILHQSAKFYPNRNSRKNDLMSIFKMADLSNLEF